MKAITVRPLEPYARQESIEEQVVRHWHLGSDAEPFDDGTTSADGWTVWILRHRPQSDEWVLGYPAGTSSGLGVGFGD